MNDDELAQRILTYLNSLCEADTAAIGRLVEYRTSCNEALADHPTCQVGPIAGNPAKSVVGMLGVINGIFAEPKIAAVFDDEQMTHLVGFTPYVPTEQRTP